MAEALQGIGNLWDNLTELHHKDPKKYQQIIEESAKEYAKLKLPPVPHTCVLARDKVCYSFYTYKSKIICISRKILKIRFPINSNLFRIKSATSLIFWLGNEYQMIKMEPCQWLVVILQENLKR